MNPQRHESTIEDAVRQLQLVISRLEHEARGSSLELHLERLAATIKSLASSHTARPPVGLEDYVLQWKEYLEEKIEELEPRTIRNLCWHPPTATDETFQYYLDHIDISLTSRALQGLVRSCHSRWSQEFAAGNTPKRIKARLERYKGPSRLLHKWRPMTGMILGKDGAERFGDEMVQDAVSVKDSCERWGIAEEHSPYVQASVRHATERCREQMNRDTTLREFLISQLLNWNGWPPDRFKDAVSQTILHGSSTEDEVRDPLRRFVLQDRRLGDPRLERQSANWAGIRDAERRVIEWLSQLDIVFFFEHVLPQGKDPHGRKRFWLRYVSRVKRSRPLLNRDDLTRLRLVLRDQGRELAHCGQIEASTSAFLLDFGSIMAVEFSAVGNACYLYSRPTAATVVPDFWTGNPFSSTKLKNPSGCLARVVHQSSRNAWHGGGWQEEASQMLAANGVRP